MKQWWQIADAFALRFRGRKAPPADKFRNVALQQQLMFFALLPFSVIFFAISVSQSKVAIPPLGFASFCIAMAVGIAILAVSFVACAKRHLYRVIEVRASDVGLNLAAYTLKRFLRWDQIGEWYIDQEGDCVLISTGGEEFVLSKELTESERLFARIATLASKNDFQYSLNYRYPNELTDGAIAACAAVAAATIISVLRVAAVNFSVPWFVAGLVVIGASFAFFRFHTSRFANLVRIGKSSLQLKTGTRCSDIPLDRLDVRMGFANIYLVKSQSDWFLVLADKDGPVAKPLIEVRDRKKLMTG